MLFYYGDKMPLRILDEADFWKLQEAEHTVVIRELAANLEPQYVQALHQWEQAFSRTHALVVRYIETIVRSGGFVSPPLYRQVLDLIQYAMRQSLSFIEFLNRIGSQSQAFVNNPVAVTVLNHIRRESEYFVGIAQTILFGRCAGQAQ